MAPSATEFSSLVAGVASAPAQRAPLVERVALTQGGDRVGVDVEVVRGVGAPEVGVAVQPAVRVAAPELEQALDMVLVEEQERQQLAAARRPPAAEQPGDERVVGAQPALEAGVAGVEDLVGHGGELAP